MFVSPLVSQAEMAINALHKRWEFIKSSQNIFVSKNDLKLVGKTEMSLEKRLKVLLAKSKNL
jgi:formate-dependent phosphoribosylglycinamide formyltransferase (GAR transformylase)